MKWLLTGKEEDKGVGKPRLPDQQPLVTEPARPCEIQEFLLAQVLRAVEEYMEKYKYSYPLEHRARLITIIYNHCARELKPPTESLVVTCDEEQD